MASYNAMIQRIGQDPGSIFYEVRAAENLIRLDSTGT